MAAYLFFTQKSITDMYNNRRIYDGSQYNSANVTAFATNTHVNRLQEKILDKVPDLSVAMEERAVPLILDNGIRWLLYVACA